MQASPAHVDQRLLVFRSMTPHQPCYTLFPYTTLFRSSWLGRSRSPPREHERLCLVNQQLRQVEAASRAELREIGRAPSELQSPVHLVCRLLLEKKKSLFHTLIYVVCYM